jgi:hypothetical protein
MIFIHGGFFMSTWKEEYLKSHGSPKCENCEGIIDKFSKINTPYRYCSRKCASEGFGKSNPIDFKYKPQVGVKYGQWEVISNNIKRGSLRQSFWRVKCMCGMESWRLAHALINKKTNSCKSCARFEGDKNKFSHSCLGRVKRRAKEANIEFDISYEYVVDLFEKQAGHCNLSGVEIKFSRKWRDGNKDQTASLDRIDNTKGYVVGNVQWIHKDVNFMKHCFDQTYFIEMCCKIASKCN